MRKTTYRNISNRAVDALRVRHELILWDRRLAGFGVRAYPSGTKTYIAQAHGPQGIKRITLGHHGVIEADEARHRAAAVIARIMAGNPPTKDAEEQSGRQWRRWRRGTSTNMWPCAANPPRYSVGTFSFTNTSFRR